MEHLLDAGVTSCLAAIEIRVDSGGLVLPKVHAEEWVILGASGTVAGNGTFYDGIITSLLSSS